MSDIQSDIRRVRAIMEILKKRFPGLTIQELLDMAEAIVIALKED